MPEAVRVDEEGRPRLRGADMAVGYWMTKRCIASDVIVRLMLAVVESLETGSDVAILAESKTGAGMSSMSRVVFEGDDRLLWLFGSSALWHFS
jgi:hypothetical protein